MNKKLKLDNLRALKSKYENALSKKEVREYLKFGLCWAYEHCFNSEVLCREFVRGEFKHLDYFKRTGYVWPTIEHHNASVEEAYTPRINWLTGKIKELEEEEKVSRLKLANLKTLKEIYEKAIETKKVPLYLKTGLCWAYCSQFSVGSLKGEFKEAEGLYAGNYVWPTITCQNASIEEALVPRLNWLINKIIELEKQNGKIKLRNPETASGGLRPSYKDRRSAKLFKFWSLLGLFKVWR